MKVTVVLENRLESRLLLIHENHSVPPSRRTVQVEIDIPLLIVGKENGVDVFETIRECWIEEVKP